jgi:hypothetical protein
MEELTCVARVAFIAFVVSTLVSLMNFDDPALGEQGGTWAEVWARKHSYGRPLMDK